MRRTIFFIFITALLLFFWSSSQAEPLSLTTSQNSTASPMTFLTCEEPPTNYLENGEVTGITTDIVKELMVRTNSTGEIKLLPWARAYKIAQEQADVVLFTAGRTTQRENLFHWVGPIFVKRWVVFSHKDSLFSLNTLDDLKKVSTIVVMRDDARAQLLKKNNFTNITEVDSHRQAIKMLSLKRAALWPSSDMEAPIIAQKAQVPFNSLRNSFVLKTILPHIIISKKTSSVRAVQWQAEFEKMVADGTLEKIGSKWSAILDTKLIVKDKKLQLQIP